jgi:hypothetical protein
MLITLALVILAQLLVVFTMLTPFYNIGTILVLVVTAINVVYTLRTLRILRVLSAWSQAASRGQTRLGLGNPMANGGKDWLSNEK